MGGLDGVRSTSWRETRCTSVHLEGLPGACVALTTKAGAEFVPFKLCGFYSRPFLVCEIWSVVRVLRHK